MRLNQKKISISRHSFMTDTLIVTVVMMMASAYFEWGWRAGYLIACAVFSAQLVYLTLNNDAFLTRITYFSMAAGFTELIADKWLIEVTGTLVYEKGGPFISRSPLYMPFAWTIVLSQLGYLSWFFTQKIGFRKASLASGVLCGVVIPLYEHCAKSARMWSYYNTPKIGYCPWFIMIGEFLIGLSLPYAFLSISSAKSWSFCLIFGIAEGMFIWGSFALGFIIISRLGY